MNDKVDRTIDYISDGKYVKFKNLIKQRLDSKLKSKKFKHEQRINNNMFDIKQKFKYD